MNVCTPLVSVIIPCLRHADSLGRCLPPLGRQAIDVAYEVIVVDSAADPAVAAVLGQFPFARLVRSDRCLRAGPARNLGVQSARGEYLVFTDADCVVSPDFLAAAYQALAGGCKMVGGPVLNVWPLHPVATMDNLLQFADLAAGRPEGAADYFPSCNLALRRTDFLAVGGFPDVDLPAGEDSALCRRITATSPEGIAYVPGMMIRHQGRRSLTALWRHQFGFGYSRAVLGLFLRRKHIRLGACWVAMPAVMAKRFCYIFGRLCCWHPAGVLRWVLFMPIFVVGLAGWAAGFRVGCKERRGA